MKKKLLLTALAATLMATALVGCGGEKQATTGTEGKVTFSVGEWPNENTPETLELWEKHKTEFDEKYPDVELVRDEWTYNMETFLPKAVSDTLPTLYPCHLTETKKIINNGYAADVTDVLKEMGWLEYMDEFQLELCEKDGRYYGVPQGVYYQGLACSVELFTEAGLVDENGVPKFPQTWDEVAEYASIIKQKTGKPGFVLPTLNNCGGWHFLNIAWSYGVDFMEQDKDGNWKATFDTQECADALQWVKDLKWKWDCIPDNTLINQQEMQKLFGTLQAGMYITSGPDIYLQQTYAMPKENWSFTKIPAGPKGRYAQVGGKTNMFAKNATAEQIEAGMNWLSIHQSLQPALTEELQEEALNNQKEQWQVNLDKDYIVSYPGNSLFNVPELEEKKMEMWYEMTNINPDLVLTGKDKSDVNILPEEPVECQALYSVLDTIIQEVLINKDADPMALVKQANADFQANYLDEYNKSQNK